MKMEVKKQSVLDSKDSEDSGHRPPISSEMNSRSPIGFAEAGALRQGESSGLAKVE